MSRSAVFGTLLLLGVGAIGLGKLWLTRPAANPVTVARVNGASTPPRLPAAPPAAAASGAAPATNADLGKHPPVPGLRTYPARGARARPGHFGIGTNLGVSPASADIQSLFRAFFASGANGENEYQVALARVKKRTIDAVPALAKMYESLSAEDYLGRRAVTHTLAELDSHESAAELISIATDPVPPEVSNDTHGFSSVREESLIRYMAMDGLSRLAGRGNAEAEAALLELAASGGATVRKRAALLYVEAGPDPLGRRASLAAVLPPEERWIASRTTVVGDQIPFVSPPPSKGRSTGIKVRTGNP